MARRAIAGRWMCCAGALALVLAVMACDNKEKYMIKDPATGQLVMPVITARIGDTWDEVKKNSTLSLKPLWMGGIGITVEEPHNFVYRGPDHEMTLDNVWYTGVFTNDVWGGGGVKFDRKNSPIASITIGPYPDSGDAYETWERMQFLYRKMEAAGWIPDDQYNKINPASKTKTVDDLKKKYDPLPGGAGGTQKFWYDNNGLQASLRLVKTITGEGIGAESRFNIVIDIQVILSSASKHAKLGENGKPLMPKYD